MAEDVFGIVGSVIASTYHVESVVAEGGFGVLYRAQHGGSCLPVALKLLEVPSRDPQQLSGFLQLFRSEAEPTIVLSASLPALVRVVHVATFTDQRGRIVPYFVLEWLEGMTLKSLIFERERAGQPPVSLRKLVRLLTPIARALERAHDFTGPEGQTSIVHGDLTLDDIFIAQVAGQEVVKLLDFGLARVKSAVSHLAANMSQVETTAALTAAHGAPGRGAPRHDEQTGPWTDVWGLARCLVDAMRGGGVIEGDPARMRESALDPGRRPTPRAQGIDLPDAVEAVFERALAVESRARQRHAGVFWNELVAALDSPRATDRARSVALADDLEFDPSSVRRPAAASTRVSAPYSLPLSAPTRVTAASRPPMAVALAAPSGQPRATASAAHFVPDLELAPPSVIRRPSGERVAATVQQPAAANEIELESASMPAALDLDLDLPADEPRALRSVSSQRLPALQPITQRPSIPPQGSSSEAIAASGERLPIGPTSGVVSTNRLRSDLNRAEAPNATRASQAPSSADVSAPFEASFVAKIEPHLPEERSLGQRLRPALVLLAAAILIAILQPIYAAATGEVLALFGQRSSLLAGVLLLLALGLAIREVVREV